MTADIARNRLIEAVWTRVRIFIVINAIITSFYTIIVFKKKIYTTKKDIIFSLIVFIIPVLISYFLIHISTSVVW